MAGYRIFTDLASAGDPFPAVSSHVGGQSPAGHTRRHASTSPNGPFESF